MTHDPFCTFATTHPDWDGFCADCDKIARIRANEKAKWTHTCPDNNCCHGSPN